MSSRLRYEIVDVFTDRPYAGNPLAVVLDADALETAQLQALAREFHLSETAFPMAPDRPEADYRVRVFTPETELPFAGHPSVGTAWTLVRLGRIGAGTVRQSCGAGLLPLRVEPGPGRVTLTGGAPSAGAELDPGPLLAAAGLGPADLAGTPRVAGTGIDFGYLPVRSDAVARARPDPAGLRALPAGVTGLYVVAYGEGAAHARMFGTDIGVAEDPATGSAALGLGAWLAAAGAVPADGETAYVVAQGAEIGRPSRLDCVVRTAGGRAVECGSPGRSSRSPAARSGCPRPGSRAPRRA